MTRRAYQVAEKDGEHALIRFAVSSAQARREGAAALDSEWDAVTCRRAPEFDQHAAAGHVPPQGYLDAGWWLTCRTCQRRVGLDLADEVNDNIRAGEAEPGEQRMDPQVHGEHVFCSPECWQLDQDRRAAEQAKVEEARAATLRTFPGVTLLRVSPTMPREPALVEFQLPGTEGYTGRLTWRVGESTLAGSVEAGEQYRSYRARKNP